MNVSRRIALTLIAGMALGAIATGPVPASQLQVVPGTPPVSVLPKPAKYTGTHGLRVAITDANPAYVQDNSPLKENEYRVRFYLNMSGLKMATNDAVNIFEAWDTDGAAETGGALAFRAEVKNPPSGRAFNACAAVTGGGEVCLTTTANEVSLLPNPTGGAPQNPTEPGFTKTLGWHAFELRFVSDAQDGNAGNNNGQLEVWVDGKKVVVAVGTGLDALDNATGATDGTITAVDYIRWGAVAGIDAGMVDATGPTAGNTGSTMRLDDFVSQRANYIGTLSVFGDVPVDPNFWPAINGIYGAEITAGSSCVGTAPTYCPANNTLRKQMAIFLLRGIHGGLYNPPACSGTEFSDVGCAVSPYDPNFRDWIYQLRAEGITGGCAVPAGGFCPDANVLRKQMAIFLLRAEHGSSYVPPACATQGLPDFTDAPCGSYDPNFRDWIYQLKKENITGGCAVPAGGYCPDATVNRQQMALFMARTFGLSQVQVGP
jgi:hypothetical protein